jgi:hypothetical protein
MLQIREIHNPGTIYHMTDGLVCAVNHTQVVYRLACSLQILALSCLALSSILLDQSLPVVGYQKGHRFGLFRRQTKGYLKV